MNKKAVVSLIVIFTVIALIVIISLLFMVNSITVEATSDLHLTASEEAEIIEDSKIVLHSNMFSLAEDVAISNIESLHPYVKVISIERKFPSKVSINVSKRTPEFAMPLTDGSYALLDRELKVLELVTEVKYPYVTIISGTLIDTVQLGAFCKIAWLSNIVTEAEGLSFVNARFATLIPSITFEEASEGNLGKIYLQINTGVTFVLENNTLALGDYFNYAYTKYMKLNDLEKSSGYIIVQNNPDEQEINVIYSDNL